MALRGLLVIPAALVLAAFSLGAYLAAFVGWFAALALGRLPAPVARYLAGYVGCAARVTAYGWLLTDRYPSVRLARPPAGPVVVDVTPGALNRLAVLIRVLLVLPAAVVALFAGAGWALLGLVTWLVALIAGRLPAPLFDAGAAILRFQTRCAAYLLLLTAAYPWGLVGDAPAPAPGDAPGDAPAPETAAAPADVVSGGDWVLSAGATGLVVLCVALGLLCCVAVGVVASVAASRAPAGVALDEVGLAHDGLLAEVQRYQQHASTCQSGTDPLGCLTSDDRQLADAFAAFVAQVRTVEYPASALPAAGRLEAAGSRMAAALRGLAGARSVAGYEQRSAASGVAALGSGFDRAFQALVAALGGGTG